jgi:hypothetical protein
VTVHRIALIGLLGLLAAALIAPAAAAPSPTALPALPADRTFSQTPAGAPAAVRVLANEVKYAFAQSAQFTLRAETERPVVQALLVVSRIGDQRGFLGRVTLAPATRLNISYTVNLQELAPPPFSRVLYTWQLSAADGTTIEVPQAEFLYEDNRFQWRGLSHTAEQPALEIRWAVGDDELGDAALNAARQSIPNIERLVGARIDSPVRIYLYPSAADMRSALLITGGEWIGAHADVDLGLIVLAAPPGPTTLAYVRNTVPHELTHLAIYSRMRDGYPSVPPWLNEGLATYLEPAPDPERARLLAEALESGTLRPLAELCQPLRADNPTPLLDYAQSESLVRYVSNRYGNHKLIELLDAHADRPKLDPAACEGVLQQVLALPADRFERDWRAGLAGQSPQAGLVASLVPWALLALAGVAVMAAFLGRSAGQPL